MKRIAFYILVMIPWAGFGQCFEDRHNTSWNDAWISCEERENPNHERGSGHWILYDFHHTYRIGNIKLWNINAPEFLASGIRDFYIDYSKDGHNWENLGQFNLSQASGQSIYEGEDVGSLAGDTARFLLITAIDTYGGACAGISEAKFEVVEVVSELQTFKTGDCFQVSLYPNPHVDEFNLSVNFTCGNRLEYGLYDHTGKLVQTGNLSSEDSFRLQRINTGDLPAGLYHLILFNNKERARYSVVKI
jgi:hypothetical protein